MSAEKPALCSPGRLAAFRVPGLAWRIFTIWMNP
jgi:hypothetical protein